MINIIIIISKEKYLLYILITCRINGGPQDEMDKVRLTRAGSHRILRPSNKVPGA